MMPHTKASSSERSVFWALTAVMFASGPHQSPHRRRHSADHLALTLCGQSNWISLCSGSFGGHLVPRPRDWALWHFFSGWSAIDELMWVFSCLFSEPDRTTALVPVSAPEVIDLMQSMWQPSHPGKWGH